MTTGRMRLPATFNTFGGVTVGYLHGAFQFNNRRIILLPSQVSATYDFAVHFHPDQPGSGVKSKLGLATLATSWGTTWGVSGYYVPQRDEVWRFATRKEPSPSNATVLEALVITSSMTATRVPLGTVVAGAQLSGFFRVVAQSPTSATIYLVFDIFDSSTNPTTRTLRLVTVNCSTQTMTVSAPYTLTSDDVSSGLPSGTGAVLGGTIAVITGSVAYRIGISSPPTYAKTTPPIAFWTPPAPLVVNGAAWWGWSNGYNRWIRSTDGINFTTYDPNPVGGFPLSIGGQGRSITRWAGDGHLYWHGSASTTVFPATQPDATCFRIDPANPTDADVVGGWHAGDGQGWFSPVCMDKITGNMFAGAGSTTSQLQASVGGLGVVGERAAPNPTPGRVDPLDQAGQVGAGTAWASPIQRLDAPFILFRGENWDGGPVLHNEGNGGDVFDLNVWTDIGPSGTTTVQLGAYTEFDTFRPVTVDNIGGCPVTGGEAKPFTIFFGIGELPDTAIWTYAFFELLVGGLNFRLTSFLDGRTAPESDTSWYYQVGANFYLNGYEQRLLAGASFPDVPDLPGRLVAVVLDAAAAGEMSFFIDGVSFHPGNYSNTTWQWPGAAAGTTSLRNYSQSSYQSVSTPNGETRMYFDFNRYTTPIGVAWDPATPGGFPWDVKLLSIHRGEPDLADMAYAYGSAFPGAALPVSLRGASASWTWSGIVAVPADTQFTTQYAPGARTLVGFRLTLATPDLAPPGGGSGNWDLDADLYVGGVLVASVTLAAGQTTTTTTTFSNPTIASDATPVWAVLRRQPNGQGYDLTVDVIWE